MSLRLLSAPGGSARQLLNPSAPTTPIRPQSSSGSFHLSREYSNSVGAGGIVGEGSGVRGITDLPPSGQRIMNRVPTSLHMIGNGSIQRSSSTRQMDLGEIRQGALTVGATRQKSSSSLKSLSAQKSYSSEKSADSHDSQKAQESHAESSQRTKQSHEGHGENSSTSNKDFAERHPKSPQSSTVEGIHALPPASPFLVGMNSSQNNITVDSTKQKNMSVDSSHESMTVPLSNSNSLLPSSLRAFAADETDYKSSTPNDADIDLHTITPLPTPPLRRNTTQSESLSTNNVYEMTEPNTISPLPSPDFRKNSSKSTNFSHGTGIKPSPRLDTVSPLLTPLPTPPHLREGIRVRSVSSRRLTSPLHSADTPPATPPLLARQDSLGALQSLPQRPQSSLDGAARPHTSTSDASGAETKRTFRTMVELVKGSKKHYRSAEDVSPAKPDGDEDTQASKVHFMSMRGMSTKKLVPGSPEMSSKKLIPASPQLSFAMSGRGSPDYAKRMRAGMFGGVSKRTQGRTMFTRNMGKDGSMERYRIAFEHVDAEGTGRLGVQELVSALVSLGFEVRAEELDKLIKDVSVGGKQEVMFEEFVEIMLAVEEKHSFFSTLKVFKEGWITASFRNMSHRFKKLVAIKGSIVWSRANLDGYVYLVMSGACSIHGKVGKMELPLCVVGKGAMMGPGILPRVVTKVEADVDSQLLCIRFDELAVKVGDTLMTELYKHMKNQEAWLRERVGKYKEIVVNNKDVGLKLPFGTRKRVDKVHVDFTGMAFALAEERRGTGVGASSADREAMPMPWDPSQRRGDHAIDADDPHSRPRTSESERPGTGEIRSSAGLLKYVESSRPKTPQPAWLKQQQQQQQLQAFAQDASAKPKKKRPTQAWVPHAFRGQEQKKASSLPRRVPKSEYHVQIDIETMAYDETD